jgi:hypothetical protein
MLFGSQLSFSPALPQSRALTHQLAQAQTLQHALSLLLALEPRARFDGVRRDGERVRVLFRLGPSKDALLALDAETNGALCNAALLDASPDARQA